MVKCNWIGFIGYILAFLFFLVGILGMLHAMISALYISKTKGWFFLLNKEDIIRRNPFNFLVFSMIILPIGVYFFIYKLGFIIIPNYWHCLTG